MSDNSAALPTTAAAVAAPAGAVANLRDFSDRLSPMLVKELRQGLRSPLFLWAFIAMHLALTIMALTTLSSESGGRGPSSFFWWTVVLVIIFALPLRGFNALLDEARLNTLDTLVLTRLTAWRIVFGKWCAIAAQCLLVAVTVLPYLILRYFGGGMNLGQECLWLGVYLVAGLTFAAILVGFSWMRFFLLRGLIALGGASLLFSFCGMSISTFLVGRRHSYLPDIPWQGFLIYFGAATLLIYYMIETGAAQIAPLSENRSTLRRVVSLVLAVGIFPVVFTDFWPGAMIILAGITGFAGLEALTELPRHFSVIKRPFVRLGALGKLAGRWLYPGWHSGLIFFLTLAVLGTGGMFISFYREAGYSRSAGPWYESHDAREMFLVVSTTVGTALYAFLLLRCFFKKSQHPFPVFLGILAATGLIHALLAGLSDAMDAPAMNLLAFFSPVALPCFLEASSGSWNRGLNSVLAYSILQTCIYLAVSLIIALLEFRRTARCEQEAEQLLREEKADQSSSKSVVS